MLGGPVAVGVRRRLSVSVCSRISVGVFKVYRSVNVQTLIDVEKAVNPGFVLID